MTEQQRQTIIVIIKILIGICKTLTKTINLLKELVEVKK